MINEKKFQHNLSLWSKTYPKAAIFLPYLDTSQYSLIKNKNGETNLRKTVEKKSFYYHSTRDPVKEADKLFSSLDVSKTEVLFVYGLGLGYIYDASKKWLKKKNNRKIIFLEDDLNVIHAFFQTERATRVLKDSQVELHYFQDEDMEDPLSTLTDLYWHIMTIKLQIIFLPIYKETKEDRCLQLQHKISYDASLREGVLSEYLQYGAAFFRNFYLNLLSLPDSYLGNDLFGKFKNMPAIICGAGPSLKKQLPLLKKLKDKALIFAGGSALNVLNADNMLPHLGAGICPNDEQLNRLRTNSSFELPFFYRNRMYHKAFQLIHGPRLYIKGSGGYDISDWFEEKLGIKGPYIEEGMNVVNFCLEIANVLECNPIIFVGVDLAYTNMEKYAPGVVDQVKVSKKEILDELNFDNQALEREDIYGKPIYTLWKWIGEARWISNTAKNNPTKTIINSTEGGLGFQGVPNIPLKTVVKKHLTKNYDISTLLAGEIQNSSMSYVTLAKVIMAMEEMRDSLIFCRDGLQVLLEENEAMSEKINNEKQTPASMQSGRAALHEIEIAEEPGYIYVLDIFNKMYACVLNREMKALRIIPGKSLNWRKAVKKLAINAKKIKFLHNTAVVNLELINYALGSIQKTGV